MYAGFVESLLGARMEESKSLDSSTGMYTEVDMLDDEVVSLSHCWLALERSSNSADRLSLRWKCMLGRYVG